MNVPQGRWTPADEQETPQGTICSREKKKNIHVQTLLIFGQSAYVNAACVLT